MKMKKVLIIPNPYLKNKKEIIKNVINNLGDIQTLIFDEPLNNNEKLKDIKGFDCFITLGGDGSLLKVAEAAAKNKVPLLGINYGGTGYLTSIKKDELKKLKKLKDDDYKIEKRLMLDVLIKNEKNIYKQIALNDVIINKKGINVPIKLEINNEDIYYGDGIVVSTPTGSSAYNYSAFGPLLKEKDKQFVLTPICPVARKNKSKKYSLDAILNIKSIRDNRDKAEVSIDGFKPILINKKSTIIISASKYYTQIIKL